MAAVSLHARQPNVLRAVIAANGTVSSIVDLDGYSIVGLIAATALTAATLSFEVSDRLGGTYVLLRNDDGTAVVTGILSGTFALSGEGVLKRLAPYRYVRIVTSVVQPSGVTFLLPVRA